MRLGFHHAPTPWASAYNSPGHRYPAGYTFGDVQVWRGEFQGTTSASAGTKATLYKGTAPLALIRVRGWIKGTDGLMRTLDHTRIASNSSAFLTPVVVVGVDTAMPATIFISPCGWSGDQYWFNAPFKIQLDWVER